METFETILDARKAEEMQEMQMQEAQQVTPVDIYNVLREVNVNQHTEKKNGLTYLSWAWAWDYVKSTFCDANYKVREWDGVPYLSTPLGIMIQTSVTIAGETITMHLPVMDGANKAMKEHPYTYQVKEYVNRQWTGGYVEKSVEAATMFDINTTIMRCLVKNLAMFGLGIYIYSGEDLPKGEKPRPKLDKARFDKALKSVQDGSYDKQTLIKNFDLTPAQLKALN